MTTNATPLSVVKIILSWSFFNSFRAFNSSLVMLEGDFLLFCALFSNFLTSTLSSSAWPCSNLGHVFSTAVMYSSTGGHLGLMTNFGPWASIFSCCSVKGLSDRLITHFLVSSVVPGIVGPVCNWVIWLWCSPWFEQPPNLHWCKASYLAFCLSITLLCLLSIMFFISTSYCNIMF